MLESGRLCLSLLPTWTRPCIKRVTQSANTEVRTMPPEPGGCVFEGGNAFLKGECVFELVSELFITLSSECT